MNTFLHVGCGPKHKHQTTRGFNSDNWQEVRLDIDEKVNPDVLGTMTDMPGVQTGSVDAVFSSHNTGGEVLCARRNVVEMSRYG